MRCALTTQTSNCARPRFERAQFRPRSSLTATPNPCRPATNLPLSSDVSELTKTPSRPRDVVRQVVPARLKHSIPSTVPTIISADACGELELARPPGDKRIIILSSHHSPEQCVLYISLCESL